MTRIRKKLLAIVVCIILIIELISIHNNVRASTYTQTTRTGIASFPESYQAKLNELQSLYPTWNFTAYYTGITWNEFITAEMSVHTRNVVISSNSLWLDSCGQSVKGGYKCASKAILSYYSDPRNFLDESGIFQFLEMTYNSSSQTEEGVKSIIAPTFMNKEVTFPLNDVETTMHYSSIIMEAARESKMSPYSIAIKIRQEVGVNGSNSVSGHYVSPNGTVYDGYYNFFNYGANDTNDPITNGLEYARNHGWTNPYIAIIEGAKTMANNYTNAGQNTAYFYKWDVVGNEPSQLFSHQYMTNIQDPSSQAKSLFNTYASNSLLTTPLNFIIPVFEAMPNINALPTTIDQTLSTSYYINGTGVRLRATPSTSGSILATLSKNEVVTLLEWSLATANSYNWSKIQTANGTIGYVANQYLVSCNNKAEVTDIAKIDGEYLIVIPNNRTVSQIANYLSAKTYSATRADSTPIGADTVVGTGYKYNLDGKTYTIIVKGDTNADGTADSLDALKILRYDVGSTDLSNEYLKAADVNNSGIVDSLDALKILQFDVNLANITL